MGDEAEKSVGIDTLQCIYVSSSQQLPCLVSLVDADLVFACMLEEAIRVYMRVDYFVCSYGVQLQRRACR